jgi:hypothetical protein
LTILLEQIHGDGWVGEEQGRVVKPLTKHTKKKRIKILKSVNPSYFFTTFFSRSLLLACTHTTPFSTCKCTKIHAIKHREPTYRRDLTIR